MNNTDRQIDSLTALFQSHYGLVLAAARRYAPLADRVDDVVQQVYVEFATGALQSKFDTKKNVGPLLFQMAKRRAQNLFRELRHQSPGNIDELAEHLMARSNRDQDDLAAIDGKIEALHRCLAKLPPASRSVVERHYFEGVPIRTIAVELKKTTETLHRFFSRIRAKLKDCIESPTNRSHD